MELGCLPRTVEAAMMTAVNRRSVMTAVRLSDACREPLKCCDRRETE